MLYNGRPNRNRRYVPNVRYILDRLDKIERLAVSPELNENEEVDMCERCIKFCKKCNDTGYAIEREDSIDEICDCAAGRKLTGGVIMDGRTVQGDQDIFNEMGKEDPREVYKEEGTTCPSCDDRDGKTITMQYHNGGEECPVCGYRIES